MNDFNLKTMERSVLIPWVGSIAVTAACLLVVVLFSTGVVALSFNARVVLALVVTAALIIFAYTTCRHLGVLKGQKRKK